MALSINSIISILSDRVGQPFNINLQQELVDIITYKRADYTRQFLDRNPQQRKQFVQSFIVEVKKTDTLDCDVDLECPWFISKCEIAQPIRSKNTIWDFVGAADFSEAYGYLEPEFVKYHVQSRFTGNKPKWFWQDNRLVITNTENIAHIGVRGIPANPFDLNKCACASDGSETCFDNDAPFPMADDILNAIIRDTLNVELRNIFPQPATVNVDKTEDTQEAGSE